jgi:hypothetical protein
LELAGIVPSALLTIEPTGIPSVESNVRVEPGSVIGVDAEVAVDTRETYPGGSGNKYAGEEYA